MNILITKCTYLVLLVYGIMNLLSCSLAIGNDSKSQLWGDDDREAVKYFFATAKPFQTMTMDLSNPLYKRFIKRHHELSGFNKKRYPGLHNVLQTMVESHQAGNIAAPTLTSVSESVNHSDLLTIMLDTYQLTSSSMTGNNTFVTEGVASIDIGDTPTSTISYASTCFYDDDGNPVGDCVGNSSFSSETYMPIAHQVSTSQSGVNSVITVTYAQTDANNKKRYISQSVYGEDIERPASLSITDPLILNPSSNNQFKSALVCVSRTINTGLRGGGACDYGKLDNSQTSIILSAEGSMVYKSTQTPQVDSGGNLVGTGSINLVNVSAGGGCTLTGPETGANFFTQNGVSYNSANKTLSWDLNNINFGSASFLKCGVSGDKIQYNLVLSTTDTTTSHKVSASQSSKVDVITPQTISPGVMKIPMLSMVQGCLVEGTLVTLDNGKKVPIETITGEGERVMAAGGVSLEVIGTTVGEEASILVLKTDARSLKLTSDHPVVMFDGSIKPASQIKTGDRVVTDEGIKKVQNISTQKNSRKVYNLIVHSGEENTHSSDGGFFYANGILVGDQRVQQATQKRERRRKKNIKKIIPDIFKEDFRSHLADKAHL